MFFNQIPFQNSKYSSSKGNYDGRYNHERMRDSPNGNSYRSDSPDSQSPRERNYQTKSSYLQKIREKERENRDYKSREKYSGKNYLIVFRVFSDFILQYLHERLQVE
jgi:hypothetical protein